MIDRCDILVTYFDKDYCLADEKKSGTRIAVEYAQKKHKHIINIFELQIKSNPVRFRTGVSFILNL